MAKRGRPRKSDELRRAQGLRGNRPIPPPPSTPATPPPVVPVEDALPGMAPAWLSIEARKVWREISPGLMRHRLLVDVDSIAFGRYCEWLVQYVKLTRATRRGKVVREPKNAKAKGGGDRIQRLDKTFQALTIVDKRLLDLEDRFGMNPRERIAIMAKLAGGSGHVPQPPAPPPEVESATPGARPIAPPKAPSSPVGFLNTTKH